MNGSGVHTFTLVNSTNTPTFVKFHWRPSVGAWLFSLPYNKSRQMSCPDMRAKTCKLVTSNHLLRIWYTAWYQIWSWVPTTPCMCLPSGVQGNQRHREPCRPS